MTRRRQANNLFDVAISTERKQTFFLDNVSLSSQRMVPELLTLTLQMP